MINWKSLESKYYTSTSYIIFEGKEQSKEENEAESAASHAKDLDLILIAPSSKSFGPSESWHHNTCKEETGN